MMVSDPCAALVRLSAHVDRLKTHITGAHDALTECAIEMAALDESGQFLLTANREGFRIMLFRVAESMPQ